MRRQMIGRSCDDKSVAATEVPAQQASAFLLPVSSLLLPPPPLLRVSPPR